MKSKIIFNEILITLEYRQLVNVPTHRLGNTLDLLIVKESDDLVGEWDVNPIFYSDHLIVSSVLDMAGVGASRTLTISRNFKNIDHNAFASDLKTKLDLVLLDSQSCVDDLVVAYNSVCQSVLDAHAPARVKSRSVRLKPKWYNEAVVNIMHVVLGVEVRDVGGKLDLTLITRNISMPNVLLVTQ